MKLNYKIYGAGKPLIILHGFMGSLDNWHSLATRFGESYQVFTVDQRNHGKSPHTEAHSIPLMVADLHAFIQSHNLENVSIIGHSMGGKVAMAFALQYPNLVEKIIVVDIAPRKYKRGHDDVFDAIFAINLNSINSRKDAEAAMIPLMPDFGTRQFLLKNLDRLEDGSYQWKMNLPVLHAYYDEITQEVNNNTPFSKPTLVIKGGNSRYISEQDKIDFLNLFPIYQFIEIPNAGHWVHAEQPNLFYEAVITFLNQ
ncbi:MAG: alpha/beta fold hydrolase [Bacteroidetes bacterium]|nr:alpha/beta fold hydrolase [Bacteroidota bacterium]